MGQFSWITQDSNESIRNDVSDGRATAYMHDNKGNVWEELEYEGYGEFGGKDFYQLLAEMNDLKGLNGNVDHDRELGIELCFSRATFISPNLTRKKKWTWVNKTPEDCPNQGWGAWT